MPLLTKSIQKLTESEAIVKIAGSDITPVTITLATDLLAPTQVVSGTPSASITGVQWAGAPGAIYKIDRNGTRVMTLLADNGNVIDLLGTTFPPDNTNPTSNITVTITNSGGTAVQGELWIRIRKTGGYASKIETAQFGSHDDPTVVGS